ncbi:MAG: FAD-binding oxidoreductase, partial [Acidimicrobiia bacterium]|nr:FAD-binding oxidoreductase [Acidimicrobiia bacterium]
MGTSLLYHLTLEGWADCLLLEKGQLASGSTWHAAGQITHSTSSYGLASMTKYGTRKYAELEAETGQSVSWHNSGSLRLAYHADELDWLSYTLAVGRGVGNRMEIVGPERIAELHPYYILDGVLGALYTPDDGHLDPASATMAFVAGARSR